MNIQCEKCGRYMNKVKPLCSICQWDYETAIQPQKLNFIAVDTVRLPQSGNVSRARIDMVKRRYIVPDGNGEVCLKNETGKPTDRSADDY